VGLGKITAVPNQLSRSWLATTYLNENREREKYHAFRSGEVLCKRSLACAARCPRRTHSSSLSEHFRESR